MYATMQGFNCKFIVFVPMLFKLLSGSWLNYSLRSEDFTFMPYLYFVTPAICQVDFALVRF